jgi:hypothetical protein
MQLNVSISEEIIYSLLSKYYTEDEICELLNDDFEEQLSEKISLYLEELYDDDSKEFYKMFIKDLF